MKLHNVTKFQTLLYLSWPKQMANSEWHSFVPKYLEVHEKWHMWTVCPTTRTDKDKTQWVTVQYYYHETLIMLILPYFWKMIILFIVVLPITVLLLLILPESKKPSETSGTSLISSPQLSVERSFCLLWAMDEYCVDNMNGCRSRHN